MHIEALENAARMKAATLLNFGSEEEFQTARIAAEAIADRDNLFLNINRDRNSIRAFFAFSPREGGGEG